MTWHAAPDLLERYAGGVLDEAHAVSVEAHVLKCETCREALAARAPAPPALWDEVALAISLPRPPLFERALVKAGVPDHVARLLGATRSLRTSWFAAVTAALAFAVASARLGGHTDLFLTIAPLVPVAGVAVAFGPGVDPTYEVGVAAPLRSSTLLLIRTVAVVGTSMVLTGLLSLFLPQLDWTVAGWLLPSLGLTSIGLALASYWAPFRAYAVTAVAWGALMSFRLLHDSGSMDAFRTGGQAAFALVAVLGVAIVARRLEAFDQRRSA